MAEIIIGDYKYNTDGSVKCVDKTKQTYGPILSEFEYEGTIYAVTNMSTCFNGCSALTQAPEIPSGVTDMVSCFHGCTSLIQAPEIPSGVTEMSSCFYRCSALIQAPGIPSSVTGMSYCFYGCSALTQAPEIPSSVWNMSSCFYGCSALTQAPEIPIGVTDMGSCFRGCSALTQAPEIPSTVTTIRNCFNNCSSLTQAPEIPSSVTNMTYCFSGCTNLIQAPEIPSSVTNMRSCFFLCSSLTQAPEIPSSVINMESCFSSCASLTGTIIIHAMPTYKNDIFTHTTKQINILPINDNDLTTDVYDFWVSVAGGYSNVSVLTEVDVDIDFVIGDYIYTRREIVTYYLGVRVLDITKTQYNNIKPRILVGNSLFETTNMSYCFYECSLLTQAPEIPSGVINMFSCFERCNNLTQAPKIPNSVTNMTFCFDGCASLTQAPKIPSDVIGIAYCFRGCSSLIQAPEIPSGVTDMSNCFNGCSSLIQAPEIPIDVTDISGCFSGCSSLTQAPEIPINVTNMSNCFSGCTLLAQAPEIPNDVIGMSYCFRGCSSLTQAPEIPSDVTHMRECFQNCYELKGNINVYNNPTNFNNIFTGTTNDIYIVNCATSTKEVVAAKWRTIASNYNKVHYEADDHPEPQLSLSVRRTDENKKSSSTGSYLVFQKSYIISQDLLPENFTPAHVESEIYKLDNEVILPIVDASGESEAIQLGDSNGHVVSYTLNDGYKTRTITANLSKIMAILDFLGRGNQAGYIDLPGMGMAIGNIATRNGLDIQFPTTIGEGLLPPTTNKVYTKAELPFDSSKTYYILNDGKYEEVINPVEEDIDNYYELTSQSVDLDNYQLVIGKYNKRDDKALFIIGNGTADNRKNSFTIDEDGYMDVVNGFEIKVEDEALLQFLKTNDSDTRIRLGAEDGSNIVIGDLGIDMFHVLADKNAKSYIHNETVVETLLEDLAGSCLSLANNSDVPNGTINKVELRAINGKTYNNWAVVSATIKKLANGTNQNIVRFDANRVESRVAIVVDSDRRLKEHINYLDKDAVDFCRELKPVIYSKNDEKHLGFYAQDVKEINKWGADLTPLINKDYMGLSYDELIAPLVAYCQHLEKRIDELESQK